MVVDLVYTTRLLGYSIAAYFIYKLVIKKLLDFKWWMNEIDKIPGPTCFSTLLGNIPFDVVKRCGSDFESSKDLFYSLMQAVQGYTHMYRKERIYRLWIGWEPWVIVWKPETAETILSHNFLLEKASQYGFLHPWLGTGLLTSSGSKWRSRRKLLVPAFHFKILHDFVPVFNEQGYVLVDKMKSIAEQGKPIDIVPIVTACTLDIICETVMGVSVGAQQNYNNSYCKAVNELGECWLERTIQPAYWCDKLYYKLERGKCFDKNVSLLHDFTMKVIKDRKSELLGLSNEKNFDKAQNYIGSNGGIDDNGRRRKAFMDLLLDHHLNGGDLSEEDIREEVDTFMFEGHDTTAMALSWIIYLLGHNPQIQERLSAEIDSLFDEIKANGEISADTDDAKFVLTLDRIKELKYLECVVKEGLRLCPSVPLVGRRCHEDLQLKDFTVPKGTIVYVFVYMLHRDPQNFPEPEKFNPDRFLSENSNGRHPFVFVPFSAGPRNCIGQRFAMSELKTVLALLFRYYRFESMDKQDKILFNMEMVLRPKVPLNVRVHRRELNKTPFNSLQYIRL